MDSLLDKLIRTTLKTTDEYEIGKAKDTADSILSASIFKSSPKKFAKWSRIWAKEIPKDQKEELKSLEYKFADKAFNIFTLLNLLKFTKTEEIEEKVTEQEPFTNVLSEEQLVAEIVALLQDSDGNYIHFVNGKYVIEGIVQHHHKAFLRQLLAVSQCVQSISQIPNQLVGIIGQSISLHFINELQRFIEFASTFDMSRPSFLNLLSFVHSKEGELLHAYAFIGHILVNGGPNYLNTLSFTQSHGNQTIREVGAKMIDSGNTVILEFVRDWVLYGTINDPFNEFFITSRDEKADPAMWWRGKYVLVKERIPINFSSDKFARKQLITMILSCGRALNYIQRFRTADFQAEREIYASKCFDLSMIPYFLNNAMSSVMDLIIKQNYLIGHLNMIHDFMLFCRGDFAVSLFYSSMIKDRSEAINILSHAKNGISVGSLYVNPVTKEDLMDHLDLKITNEKETTIDIDPRNINVTYSLQEPINTVISRSDMYNYSKISKFLWHMKQIQMQLSIPWKSFKTPIVIKDLNIDDSSIRKYTGLRTTLLYVSISLNEWLWTDVIHTSRKDMERRIKNATCFDDIQKIHKKHIQSLQKGMLLSDQFSTECTALTNLVDILDNFISQMNQFFMYLSDLDNEYNYGLENGDLDEYFISAAESELKEFCDIFDNISTTYRAKFRALYILTSNNLAIPELSHLELRLRSCRTYNRY